METIRAATYSRVSTERQDGEDRVSLGEQVSEMEAYAERRGITIVARYQDVASGVRRDRPEFQRMQADARRGEFDLILAWNADRLARSGSAMGDLLDSLEPHGVAVDTVRGAFDKHYAELMAAIAKMERQTIVERTMLGRRGAAKAGRIPSKSLPFGYCIVDGRPEIDEYRAAVVRRIYEMCVAEELGTYRIADVLTAEGVPTPGGGLRWWAGTVQPILANPTYTGVWRFGQRRVRTVEGGRKVSRTDRAEQIDVPVPVIIDGQTWERAQRVKQARRRHSGGSRRHSYLLSRMLRCGTCGNGLHGLAREGGTRRYYKCSSSKYGLRCHEHPYIPADKLEGAVWEEVADSLADPDSFVDTLLSMNDAGNLDALEEEIVRAEADLLRVTTETDRMIRLYVTGQIDDDQLRRQRRFVDERREAAEERLAGLRQQAQTVQDRDIGLDSVREWVEKIGDRLDDLDDAGRREVLLAVLEGVIVGDDTLRLNFVLPVEPAVSVATSTPGSAWRSGPTAAYGLPM